MSEPRDGGGVAGGLLAAERAHLRRRRAQVRAHYQRRPRFVVVAAIVLAYFLAWPFADYWLRTLELARQTNVDAALRHVPGPLTGLWHWSFELAGAGQDTIATRFRFYDWGAYGTAVDRWQSGEVIYERNENGGYFGTFLYPPLVLLLFAPFHDAFSFRTGAMVWEAGSVLALWIGLQLVIRELGYRLRWWERGLVLWATVGYQPLLFGAKMGQTPAFLVAVLSFAFVALARRRRGSDLAGYVSGGLTGIVGFVKLAYAPVGAHLLEDRDRLTGAVAVGAVLLGASIGIFGLEVHRTYVDVLAWGATNGGDPRSPNLWLPGYYKPLGWIDGALYLRVALSGAVAAVAVLSRDRAAETFALGLAAFPLLTPTTYSYYLVALLPAGLITLGGELRRGGYPSLPLLGLLLANAHAYGTRLVSVTLHGQIPIVASNEWLYYALQPGIYAPLLIGGVAYLRVAESVAPPPWTDPYVSRAAEVTEAVRRRRR